jgi:hypothetical protein
MLDIQQYLNLLAIFSPISLNSKIFGSRIYFDAVLGEIVEASWRRSIVPER